MHWLLHGNTTPAVGDALRRREDVPHLAVELALTDPNDLGEVLEAARQRQWDIITTDANLANAPFEQRIRFPRTIVYLQLEGGDVEQDDAVDRLFARYKRLSPRRLYTVTAQRVKIRQLPGAAARAG